MQTGLKKLWDNYIVTAQVRFADKAQIEVAIGCRGGIKYLCLRKFMFRSSTGDWLPTIYGFNLPFYTPNQDKTIYYPGKNFLKALIHTFELVNSTKLEDPDNEVWWNYKPAEGNKPIKNNKD